jgi:NADH-quinone oxidoreductase subunit G
MRVLPRVHEGVNEEWISDKTRYACDGLKRQRLDQPFIRKSGRLQSASWSTAFAMIADRLSRTHPEKMGAIVGDLAAAEGVRR